MLSTCWRVVPKTVAGFNLLVRTLAPLSDEIVASWIKGGERVRLNYVLNKHRQTMHRPGMVATTRQRMVVGGSGNHQRIPRSSVHHPPKRKKWVCHTCRPRMVPSLNALDVIKTYHIKDGAALHLSPLRVEFAFLFFQRSSF